MYGDRPSIAQRVALGQAREFPPPLQEFSVPIRGCGPNECRAFLDEGPITLLALAQRVHGAPAQVDVGDRTDPLPDLAARGRQGNAPTDDPAIASGDVAQPILGFMMTSLL